MDRLRLEVKKLSEKGFAGQTEEAFILVNGRALVEILGEYESRFLREGNPT